MKSKTVLIVEDNDLNRKLFENLIGQIFSFQSAKNGLEAVSMTAEKAYDLILMDIQMPQMDGISAMKKIRQGNSTCPILAVTAFAEESDRSIFLDHGFDDFITKPIRPKEFIQLIRQHLSGAKKTPDSTQSSASSAEILNTEIITQLLKYNSKSLIRQILEDFLQECKETEQLIAQGYPEAEFEHLLEKIHIIKGNSGTLGAMRIYEAALRAEDLGRNKKTAEFHEAIKIIQNEITQFREFLKQETIFEP
ncbi:response regulator [Algoriphagus litoralis]|uniref:response regulator n=1 Tax=Algoriphagus litoralis TaxID=2202829 RepID=UPI000DB9CC6D|nr:response regulator [Algoriphagus litoralis]